MLFAIIFHLLVYYLCLTYGISTSPVNFDFFVVLVYSSSFFIPLLWWCVGLFLKFVLFYFLSGQYFSCHSVLLFWFILYINPLLNLVWGDFLVFNILSPSVLVCWSLLYASLLVFVTSKCWRLSLLNFLQGQIRWVVVCIQLCARGNICLMLGGLWWGFSIAWIVASLFVDIS